MLTSKQILELFEDLNENLKQLGEKGEIGLVGGAVMCLVYQARNATKDVDAIFAPTQTLRKLVLKIAHERKLDPHWLNDAAKGYLTDNFRRDEVVSLSHLRVWAPEPKYMLAMKCISARWDSSDRDDVLFLIKFLKLKKAKEVFLIIEGFYPKNRIPPKTQFMIEEVFERKMEKSK